MLLLAICRVALLTQFAVELFALAAGDHRATHVAIPTATVARHRHHDVADAVGIVDVCVVVVVVVAGIEEFAATAVLVQHVCEHFFFVGEQLAALGTRDGEDRRRVLQPMNDVLMMVIAVSVVVVVAVDGVTGGNGVENRVVDHACRRGRRRSAVSGARLGRVATTAASVCA